MSLLAAGIGVVSGFFGGGPDYASSLGETNAAGKKALGGDLEAVETLKRKRTSRFAEVRAAATAWLGRVAATGSSPEVRAQAGATLAGGTSPAPVSPSPVAGLPALPGGTATPWVLVAVAIVLAFLLFRRR